MISEDSKYNGYSNKSQNFKYNEESYKGQGSESLEVGSEKSSEQKKNKYYHK
jgi:hypothetical protein